MALSIAVTRSDAAVTHIGLVGEIDLSTVADLQAAVTTAISVDRASKVVVDLDAVTFCDSTGLGGLIRARHLADAFGVVLQVVNPRDRVRWVMDISGVAGYLGASLVESDKISPG